MKMGGIFQWIGMLYLVSKTLMPILKDHGKKLMSPKIQQVHGEAKKK